MSTHHNKSRSESDSSVRYLLQGSTSVHNLTDADKSIANRDVIFGTEAALDEVIEAGVTGGQAAVRSQATDLLSSEESNRFVEPTQSKKARPQPGRFRDTFSPQAGPTRIAAPGGFERLDQR